MRKGILTDVVNPIAGMVLDLEPLTLLHITGLDTLGPKGRHVEAIMPDFGRDPGLDGCVNRRQTVLHLILMMNQEWSAEFHHGTQLLHRMKR